MAVQFEAFESHLREAIAAGRDISSFLAAAEKVYERRRLCKPHDAALKSAVARWREVCDISRREADACVQVAITWAQHDSRRIRHIVNVQGNTTSKCLGWAHGGTHGVHWRAMRMRRWMRLLGLEDQVQFKLAKRTRK